MITLPEVCPGALVSERDAAEFLGCTIFCLRAWRQKRIGVPVYKVGRLVKYKLSELHDYVNAGRIEPISRAGENGQKRKGVLQ